MRLRLHRYALACFLPPAALLAAAADEGAPLPGNAAHGAQLVSTCADCHGRAGEGVQKIGFPRLAGQYGPYLAAQMHDFAARTRVRPIMTYAVKTFSEQDLADIGAYYAAMDTPPSYAISVIDPAEERGHQLVLHGDKAIGVPPCAACHGPQSQGLAPAIPYLAGQHAAYIREQLIAWQKGDRHSERGEPMGEIARRLSDYDIDQVAAWLSRQLPPQHP